MKFGFYFLSLLFIGLLFEIALPIQKTYFPNEESLFLLSDHKMYFRSYVYYTCEHIIYFLLALMVSVEIKQARMYATLFCVLELGDIADFWITANGDWFEYQGYPITYNVIKVLVFILVIIYEYAWDFLTSDPTGDVPRT